MTTEKKVKKNPDFGASAVKLCNPPIVLKELNDLRDLEKQLADAEAEAQAIIPKELTQRIDGLKSAIADADKAIRTFIDSEGSYQDVEAGVYGLKYSKQSVNYNANAFVSLYPEYETFAVTKMVDPKAFALLQKAGKLADEAKLKELGIISVSETFAYKIKA